MLLLELSAGEKCRGPAQTQSVVTRWSQCRQHSKMNCCHALLKYFLIISNLVIGLLGLLILSGGLWLHFGEGSFEETVEGIKNQTSISSEEFKKVDETLETLQQHDNLNYFLLAVGGVAVFVSFFGCCGAKRESVCLLTLYSFLTIILIVLQIAAIVILNINKHLQGEIAEKLEIKLEGSYDLSTMFFGATTGVSILYLIATLCFCRSVKDSETSGKYSTELDRFPRTERV